MKINSDELESVDVIGFMDGDEVKMVKTVGGLYVAIGKNKGKEEVLSAGSHPAIVRHNLQKTYIRFRPSLMKSERQEQEYVSKMTALLPKDMTKSGYDLYTIKKSNYVDILLTRQNIEEMKWQGTLTEDSFKIAKSDKVVTADYSKVIKSVIQASGIIAEQEGKDWLVHQQIKVKPKSVLK